MNFRGLLFLLCASIASGQGDGTALSALKLLPKDAAKRLVRIEARDGAPAPERWYFLVYDPGSPRGVREFVVSGGRVVASRALSQFADFLDPADVVGADSVKFDSDQLARLVGLYAAANDGQVGSLNYELTRDPSGTGPVWSVTLLDSNGDQIGVLVVTAAKGVVVRHDGFEKEPAPDLVKAPVDDRPLPRTRSGVTAAATGGRSRPTSIRATTPAPTPKVGALNRLGDSMKRFFGADTGKPGQPPR